MWLFKRGFWADLSSIVEEQGLDASASHVSAKKVTQKRWSLFSVLFLLTGILLVSRAAYLQIGQGVTLHAQSEANRLQTVWTDAPRGRILDTNGLVLADAASAFTLWVQPSFFEELSLQPSRIFWLAKRLQVDPDMLQESLPTPLDHQPVRWRVFIPYQAAITLLAEQDQYAWYRVAVGSTRSYMPTPAHSLSHVLGSIGRISAEEWPSLRNRGYRSEEWVGKSGLEKTYESSLRGFPGVQKQEVDVHGQVMTTVETRPPETGATLLLGLDVELQIEIERIVQVMMQRMGKRKVAIIALDPRSGLLRALVSLPSFNANDVLANPSSYTQLLTDTDQPLFPRAVSGQYPPGSTFKLIMAAAALDAGIITDRSTVFSSGGIRIGRFFFPDWKAGGHGTVDVRSAIANSVNTFFYMIGGGLSHQQGLGILQMGEAAKRFGVGEKTGIDVPGEAIGFFPTPQWKEQTKSEMWYIGDTYHAAIGQGDVLLTPLQVASITSAIANGGTRYTPHLVERIKRGSTEEVIAPSVLGKQVGTPDSLRIVRQGMRQTVLAGSAKALQSVPIAIAGKTGTAQWSQGKATHAWFTGFAPFEDPEIVVTVLVEEGGEGSSVSVPLARDIFLWWYQHR